ncbi:unnamed protein product [marine sediment metagenome]|uniref:Uncharacterized protein n=1 Tax=marine sediment metagenome TaxID=412755 RepID=X1M2T6_9ZZZZ
MKLTNRQRENLSKAFFNSANFIFAIVILGSFISKEFDIPKITFGVTFWIIFIIVGVILDKGEKDYWKPEVLQEKISYVSGNKFFRDLSEIDEESRKKLDEAFKKILNTLVIFEPELDLKISAAELKNISALGKGKRMFGYWVEGDGKYYLLLDAQYPDYLKLKCSEQTDPVVLWDFPVLKDSIKIKLERKGKYLVGKVEGPFALVTGLSEIAHY